MATISLKMKAAHVTRSIGAAGQTLDERVLLRIEPSDPATANLFSNVYMEATLKAPAAFGAVKAGDTVTVTITTPA